MGRVSREARDMDVPPPNAQDAHRLEVVVDGLPVRGGAQVAIGTTLVCALHRDGAPRRGAATTDGVALRAARMWKERTYPELVCPQRRAQLIVVGVEVGGPLVRGDQTVSERLSGHTSTQ